MRIEQHPIINFNRGKKINFTFDGQNIEGFEGESIAAALHSAGVRTLSHSHVKKRSRGLYCAIGNCSSCMMIVDGRANVKTCLELVMDGMKVETQTGKGEL